MYYGMKNKYLTILAAAILLINLSSMNNNQDGKASHGKTDGYNINSIKIVDI
jgi:hypothetical protein